MGTALGDEQDSDGAIPEIPPAKAATSIYPSAANDEAAAILMSSIASPNLYPLANEGTLTDRPLSGLYPTVQSQANSLPTKPMIDNIPTASEMSRLVADGTPLTNHSPAASGGEATPMLWDNDDETSPFRPANEDQDWVEDMIGAWHGSYSIRNHICPCGE
jgi:hypothetical protein